MEGMGSPGSPPLLSNGKARESGEIALIEGLPVKDISRSSSFARCHVVTSIKSEQGSKVRKAKHRSFEDELLAVAKSSEISAGKVSVLLKARQELVRMTVKQLGWNIVPLRDIKTKLWDIAWVDHNVEDMPSYLMCVKSHHRINHLPGIWNLSRKKNLAINLQRLQDAFPDEYRIFPKTYVLPEQHGLMLEEFTGGNRSKKPDKPDARCQGRGIFMTRNLISIDRRENLVVQRYLVRPLLLNGFKADLRLYLLITSVSPLRCYTFYDGLVRLCTERYAVPTTKNLDHMFIHLTNYSIQKNSDKFEHPQSATDTSGSKWTFRKFKS